MITVLVEHDRGKLAPATLEALAFARRAKRGLASTEGTLGGAELGEIEAVVLGRAGEGCAPTLAEHGAASVTVVDHPLLDDYGPEAWGHALAGILRFDGIFVLLASGTDLGNEVLAHAAALLDVPFAANCTAVDTIDLPGRATVTRVRWGGSLIEHATIEGRPLIMSVALHAVEAVAAPVESITAYAEDIEIPDWTARTRVADRVEREAGVTLATAPIVVGGGRGVGSADGFAALEELAGLLGGVVGCSRAVTNNGWRNHTDQVGQTGTRIAPEIYIACGISGAIQHWVGAMASKRILAINTDAQANMVVKADAAVIGDLHQVVPAISAEVRRRRGESSA